ncbi:MAG TPA: FAD-dependent oxidoreductase [Xanthobacteraceae bacterium]
MGQQFVHESLETPVVGHYDVIVAGGGASGLIAALAAARLGARTLMLERQGCLGGTATSAYVAQYVGFFHRDTQAVWGIPYELTQRIVAAGGSNGFGAFMMGEAAANPLTIRHFPFNPEIVMTVMDELAGEAGIDLLLHARVVDVVRAERMVKGVVVETISGRKAYAARVIIDATGDAALAHRAGVDMLEGDVGRQPSTLCFRLSNVDVTGFRSLPREVKRAKVLTGLERGELFWQSVSFVSTPGGTDAICLMSRIQDKDALDDVDASDQERIGRAQVKSIVAFLNREMPGFEKAILANIAPRVGVRETRRIAGQYTLTADDILGERRFEDAIALGCGPMDVHDPSGSGIALSMPPAPFEIPMRCLVPKDVEGLLVTGRAISATHAANGGARHMATAMALGQAAGVMAAVAIDRANSTLSIPSARVQAGLRAQGAALCLDDCRALAEAHS